MTQKGNPIGASFEVDSAIGLPFRGFSCHRTIIAMIQKLSNQLGLFSIPVDLTPAIEAKFLPVQPVQASSIAIFPFCFEMMKAAS